MRPFRSFVHRHRLDLALAGCLLAVVGPFVPDVTAQGGARYTLTAAIVEQGTLQLDDYRPLVGFDRVERDGHLYSDKAPGQPLLGVPVLAAAEALGVPPGTEHRVRENVGQWTQIIAFCTIPAAALLVLMRRHAGRTESARAALIGALALSSGTMLLPFASTLYGHMLVAALSFAAWHLVSRAEVGPGSALGAGALAALATASEYPLIYTGGVIGLWVWYRHGFGRAVTFGIPHLVVIPLMIVYNQLAYGRSATGYTEKSGGRLNWIRLPDPSNVVDIFLGTKGFVFTPIVIAALIFLVIGLRRRRLDLVVPAAVFAGYFVLQAGWPNPWGGEGPGPRYIAPALPFLAVPAAMAVAKMRPLVRNIVLGIGALSMGLVVLTFELVPIGDALIVTHLRSLFDGRGLNPTVFTLALGPAGWVVHAGLAAVAVRAVVRTWPARAGEIRSPHETVA